MKTIFFTTIVLLTLSTCEREIAEVTQSRSGEVFTTTDLMRMDIKNQTPESFLIDFPTQAAEGHYRTNKEVARTKEMKVLIVVIM